MSFSRCYQRFCSSRYTLAMTEGTRERWHQGRRWYHVWVILLEDVSLMERKNRVYQGMYRWLTPFTPHQPHVTVWVHGFDSPPTHPQENTPIPLSIGGANSFLSCPFLEVRSPTLKNLRAQFTTPEERWSPYLPHLTLGRYNQRHEIKAIRPFLQSFRVLPSLHVTGFFRHCVVDAFSETGDLHHA